MLLEVFEILWQNSQGKANRLAHRILFTAGYGNQSEPHFVERLKSFNISLILDVRRKEARSWNPVYRPGYLHIGDLFKRNRIPYWFLLSYSPPRYDFGNRFDTLAQYRDWIFSHPKAQRTLDNIAAFIEGNTAIIPCLLCAERSHQKCHRTIVAEELLKYINAITERDHSTPWTIQHI